MKHVFLRIGIIVILACCILLSGCDKYLGEGNTKETEQTDISSLVDYVDWYRDVDNTGVYNYVQWIELDIWFIDKLSEYNWTDITFDVVYEGQIIASELPVDVDVNYVKCYYDISCEGIPLTDNGYFAPGSYEVILHDNEDNTIVSSDCLVTIESGDALSKMVTGIEQVENNENEIAIRISFDGDITPYTNAGIYLMVSLDGGTTSFIPEKYSIDLADTYMTVRYIDPDISKGNVMISIFGGDNSFVCSSDIVITGAANE